MTFPYKLIDLTHTLNDSIPTWEGGCGFNHKIQLDYDDCDTSEQFRIMKINMLAGIGTHVDAPKHCFAEGKSIHEFDVNDLCMPCIVIDVSSKAHEYYNVIPDDIKEVERVHGTLPPNSCVIIKTGWERFWSQPEKYRNNLVFPSISAEAADLLLERGIAALGIDTLSPDRPEDGFNVHQAFLSKNKLLLENVANLDNMPTIGAYIMVLPIKVEDGTEAPVRLVGLILQH